MPWVKDCMLHWLIMTSVSFINLKKTNVEVDAPSQISRPEHTMLDMPTVKAMMSVVTLH